MGDKIMTTHKTFIMRIKEFRAERGMPQEALAENAGISRVSLARLETEKQDPSGEDVIEPRQSA
jgi:DNA-binding XRE family transcriptional regulator